MARLKEGIRPDVVILDQNMPGLGGPGPLAALKAIAPDFPVVLATGRIDQVTRELAASYPHVTLLQKPFTAQERCSRFPDALR